MSSCSSKKKHSDDCCFSCCEEKVLVQDKLCCDFSLTAVSAQTANVFYIADPAASCGKLVASGTIRNCSTTDAMTVQFVSGRTVIRDIVIPAGGCVTFTLANFDTIRGFRGGASTDAPPVNGEICITPRYTI